MASLVIWMVGMALELAILLRSFRSRLLRKYPVFFAYLAFVFASELSRFVVYRERSSLYPLWWWSTELAGAALGYWLIMDVAEKALARSGGARRFTRYVMMVVLAASVFITSLKWIAEARWSLVPTSLEVEQNLRIAEVIILVALISIAVYYGVPIGRNLRGIILGYGLFVGVTVIDNSLRMFIGGSFRAAFSAIQANVYIVALVIWTITLWSFSPVPLSETPPRLETDYQKFATMTREVVLAMRSYLGRSGRK